MGNAREGRMDGALQGGEEDAMTTRAACLLCGIVVFGAYTVLALNSPMLPGPPNIKITPPSPDLAPKLAALSGVWEPAQRSFPTTRVVVEQINETWATILLTGREDSHENSNGGWERVRARVFPDGEVRWGYPVRFALRIAEDGATLEGKSERAGVATRTTLKKVGAFVDLTGLTTQATLTEPVRQPGREPGDSQTR
jgi:hypothetical protein